MTTSAGGASFFFIENVNFDELIVISIKNASDRGGETVRFQKRAEHPSGVGQHLFENDFFRVFDGSST